MAFPNTPVLDDFNRADNPTSLGASWSGPIESGFSSMGVISNTAYGSVSFVSNYWGVSFGEDQEAYVDMPVMPAGASWSLMCRIQNPGGSYSGYRATVDSGPTLFLESIVFPTLTFIANASSNPVAGDSIGISCSGTTIKLFLKHSGSWSEVLSVTNSTVTGAGYIGLYGSDIGARFDNFGGGIEPLPVVAWLRA